MTRIWAGQSGVQIMAGEGNFFFFFQYVQTSSVLHILPFGGTSGSFPVDKVAKV